MLNLYMVLASNVYVGAKGVATYKTYSKYKTAGVRRLIFQNNVGYNYNRYTIGSGVGAKSKFVRSALYKHAAQPSCPCKLNTNFN